MYILFYCVAFIYCYGFLKWLQNRFMYKLVFLQTIQGNLDTLLKEEALCREKIQEKEAQALQLNKDIDDQKPKLERATKQVSLNEDITIIIK